VISQQRSLTAKRSHSKEIFHSKEVSQQSDLTAKRSHSKEQRSLTAKKSHSKGSKEISQQEISQQRGPAAKRSHSKEVTQQGSLARKLRFHIFNFQFLREVSHEMRF